MDTQVDPSTWTDSQPERDWSKPYPFEPEMEEGILAQNMFCFLSCNVLFLNLKNCSISRPLLTTRFSRVVEAQFVSHSHFFNCMQTVSKLCSFAFTYSLNSKHFRMRALLLVLELKERLLRMASLIIRLTKRQDFWVSSVTSLQVIFWMCHFLCSFES